MKKRILVSLYACILACFIIFSSVGCFEDKRNFEIVGKCRLWVEYSEGKGYACGVNGEIKNKSSETFDFVSVEFTLYDAQGKDVGTAIATFHEFEGEESKEFLAVLIGFASTEPVSFKLKEIKSI